MVFTQAAGIRRVKYLILNSIYRIFAAQPSAEMIVVHGDLSMASAPNTLRFVRLLHTLVWAFFAGCIVAIPVFASRGKYAHASVLSGIVLFEVLVLLFNGWRCPLTDLAARYTEDRRANFDIYLPEWLARRNKAVFGVIYVAGILLTLLLWTGWLR